MTGVTAFAPTVAVIVNFRTAAATIAAIQSLQRSTFPFASIVVVDNGSGDGSAEEIRTATAGITMIAEQINTGFSAGCNIGIRRALAEGAEQIFLLNPDASVAADAVGRLASLLSSDIGLGIVGPVVVTRTEPARIESFGISLSRASGRVWNLDHGRPLTSVARLAQHDVDAIAGCAMLIKRSVFERVGLLDEAYFFGFEDIDLCLRARAAGYRCAVTPSAVIEHAGQSSIGKESPARIYYATRNHLLLGSKTAEAGASASRTLRTIAILSFNLLHVLFTSNVPRASGLGAFVSGARDYFSGKFGPENERDPAERPKP